MVLAPCAEELATGVALTAGAEVAGAEETGAEETAAAELVAIAATTELEERAGQLVTSGPQEVTIVNC